MAASRGELHNQVYSWKTTVQNLVQKMMKAYVCLNLADVLEGSAADRLSMEKAPWLVMMASADFNFQLK